MSLRTEELSKRIETFKDDVIAFVEQLSDEDCNVECSAEEWTARVTARHIGAGHFGIFGMAQMILEGKELPQLTIEQINEMSEKDSREHSEVTRDDALEALKNNGAKLATFVAGLSDDDLDRKGSMPAFGGEASINQIIEFVIFQSAREHFDNIKKAVGK